MNLLNIAVNLKQVFEIVYIEIDCLKIKKIQEIVKLILYNIKYIALFKCANKN